MPGLRLFLLGPLDVQCNDQQVPKPPTQKSQSLLAYLALHRQQPQTREQLAGMFWGERPERKARRSLTTALWHIRRCLPDEDLLLSDVHTVQLDPETGLWLDVVEFESLVARPELDSLRPAVELYRGDFMAGFYDDWVLNERYRLEMLFAEALAQLMIRLEAAGDHAGALTTGQRLLAHDPLREDAHRLAMRALCRLGRRSAALEQYRRCQETVTAELGVEPMEETIELYRAILDGQLEAGPPVAMVPIVGTVGLRPLPPGQDPLDPIVRGPLVGREQELAFLQDCYEEARSGQGGLVMVRGEAGMGKTRLMEEFTSGLLWQGVRVLWGHCYEFERLLPHQPVAEALESVLPTLAPSDLARLPEWVLAELARLIPELSDRLPGRRSSAEAPLDQAQKRLFDSVAHFLASLSSAAPLVLVLDDIHWATGSTLQMVHYLVRRLDGQPILLVGTLRPEAVGSQHPVSSFQRQLRREGWLRALDLEGLSLQAVGQLVTEMSGSDEAVLPLAHRLYEETEGNPFFLIETIKALFEAELVFLEDGFWRGDFEHVSEAELPLPAGVNEAIQARLDRLDEDARQALRVAAVLGREFDFDLLRATWQQGEEEILEALDALLRRRFIDEGRGALGRDYAFHHHQIREVVYASIPLRHRQHLHARAGRAMEAIHPSESEIAASELAFHFQRARMLDPALEEKAIGYLLLAGDQARLEYAYQDAIEYYQEALALQEERGEYQRAGRTLMKLGLTYHNAFEFKAAQQAYQEGFSLWQRAGRRDLPVVLPPAPHALRFRWRRPYTLDPALCNEYVSSLVIRQIFSGLVTTTPDLDVVPEVAQRWQVLDGGRRYRFYLRPDTRWSDGTPLTAHDFEYAWKRVLHPATDADASTLVAIKGGRAFHEGQGTGAGEVGVRALDAGTLEVELENPASHFLHALTHPNAYPVPEHVLEALGASWTDVGKIVSNGPFRLEAWDKERHMRLARNPSYAGARRGNVEQIVLHFPQDPATLDLSAPLAQYLRGELDVLPLTDARVHEGDRIRRQYADEYLSVPWLYSIYLGLVTDRPPFDDARLRQALALATDREELADVVLRGMYAAGTGGFLPRGMPGHSPHIGFSYDPGRARQLLAGAGHTAADGIPVLEGLSVPPIGPLIFEYLQAQWQQNLGIQVTWDVADWPPFQRRMQHDPPHLFLLARFAGWPDPARFLTPGSIGEYTRWANPAYDELLAKAARTPDQAESLALVRRAEQLLVHEAPIVPLHYGRLHMLVKPWVRSFPVSALNHWYCKDAIIEPH